MTPAKQSTERSIRLYGHEVRAIIQRRQTQLRRIIKPQPTLDGKWWSHNGHSCNDEDEFLGGLPYFSDSPFGRVGDRLWVQETFATHPIAGGLIRRPGDGHQWGSPIYRATFSAGMEPVCEGFTRWRPSIHMPRWASRLTLDISGIRAERLQDISEADARAEGGPPRSPSIDQISQELGYADFPRSWFAQVWDSIYASPKPVKVNGETTHYESYPWDDIRETREYRGKPWYVNGNPLVRVGEFKKCDAIT